jgi:hypothetical protein
LAGLRKYPPIIDHPDWNSLVDFLGGETPEAQLCTLKILLHGAESTALSAWQYSSDKSKIDGAVIAGLLDAVARVKVRKNSGAADVGARRRINFIEGSNVTLTIADDPTDEEVDVTIASSGGGGGAAAGWENVVCYPWAGTAVLSADPLYTYTDEVSENAGSYAEVAWFDFDMPAGTIKSVFANLVWAVKITGSGTGLSKWQVASGSHASPGTYYDITDEISANSATYNDFSRSGVAQKITDFPTSTPFTVRCLVKRGTATSAEAKVKCNTYFRVTFKVS